MGAFRWNRILAVTGGAFLLLCLPALADSRIERELSLAPGGRLAVDTDAGSVTVTGTGRPGARVVITASRDDLESLFAFDFQETEGLAKITAHRKGSRLGSWFHWGSQGALHFEIEVPRETALDIDTSGGSIRVEATEGATRLDTSGGSIQVSKLKGDVLAGTSGGSIGIQQVEGEVNVDTSGGSIDVNGVRGSLRAETSGGSIQIFGVTGDLEAQTSGGSIRIGEAGGRVTADTSGGSVAVSFARGNSRGGYLSTSGGRVVAVLDPSASLDVDAAASGGSVSCELPVTVRGTPSKSSLLGELGGGGELLKLRASGGGVRIESL